MRIRYRLWQFYTIVTAQPLPATAWQTISAVLREPELSLFRRFSTSDQHHSYRVLCTLQQAGHTHPALQTAALLHDIGKTRFQLTVWERSAIVLGQVLAKKKLKVWGEAEAAGWKRPFVVKARHPQWSAEMAQAAGCHPMAVSLIRRHQGPLNGTAETEEDRLLALLQWADDQN